MVVSGHQITVADMRTLDVPDVDSGKPIAIGIDDGTLIANLQHTGEKPTFSGEPAEHGMEGSITLSSALWDV